LSVGGRRTSLNASLPLAPPPRPKHWPWHLQGHSLRRKVTLARLNLSYPSSHSRRPSPFLRASLRFWSWSLQPTVQCWRLHTGLCWTTPPETWDVPGACSS